MGAEEGQNLCRGGVNDFEGVGQDFGEVLFFSFGEGVGRGFMERATLDGGTMNKVIVRDVMFSNHDHEYLKHIFELRVKDFNRRKILCTPKAVAKRKPDKIQD